MTLQEHINDTLIHRMFFTQECIKILNYLFATKQEKLAMDLSKRCLTHDITKLDDDEIEGFLSLPTQKTNKSQLTKEQRNAALSIHYLHNAHHPEHYHNISDMSDVDIIEMCCDWSARAIQFGNNLMDLCNSQNNRFAFTEYQKKEIEKYCKILSNP